MVAGRWDEVIRVLEKVVLAGHLAGEFLEGRQGGGVAHRVEALLHAARVRLRPILMTTLAMIFGMVPLAFALTEGSEQRAPMGQAVIGGVITSSLLTLVVVPVVYCYLDDFALWIRRKLGSPRRAAGGGGTVAPVVAFKIDRLS